MNTLPAAFVATLAMTIFVMGCSERQDSGSAPVKTSRPPPEVTEPVPDGWLGKWTGPEGTFLQIAGGSGQYEITVQNLDGPRKFRGTVAGSGIAFERDGSREVIRASNGDETGMKWLAGKSNCLTVRVGEGYCRD